MAKKKIEKFSREEALILTAFTLVGVQGLDIDREYTPLIECSLLNKEEDDLEIFLFKNYNDFRKWKAETSDKMICDTLNPFREVPLREIVVFKIQTCFGENRTLYI